MARNESRNGLLVCPGCDEVIISGAAVVHHQRLNCYIHRNPDCWKNVYGEDISSHTMTFMNIMY